MVTYFVSADAVALGLSEKEKNSSELLVRQCLKEHGMVPWEHMESEIFLSAGESLLIARPKSPRTCRLNMKTPRLRRL